MKKVLHIVRKNVQRRPLFSLLLSAVASLILGALIFFSMQGAYTFPQQNTPSLRLSDKAYPLISPLLLCSLEQKDINEDKPLEQIIKNFTQERISTGEAQNISTYVINYKTGQWAGVHEDDHYDPASLLKVPVMIAYYRVAETNSAVLSQQIAFKGDDQNTDEHFKSPNDIQSGKFYSAEELIRSMIVNSDNTALVLLQKSLDPNSLSEIYTDLGLPVPSQSANVDYISAKLYAYFFRVLYNSTYLNRDYSEKALELLSQPDFPQGIRSGVPQGTSVAQKFGERSVYGPNNTLLDRELHDCGIVYKPDSPYLLCIMSRGKDFDALAKNISDLSRLLYQNIGI